MTNTPFNRKLNDNQLAILELLLKFRFGTRQLISDYFSQSRPGMDTYRKLQVLEKRGLIGKRFEPRYRLQAKPAAYYLLPEGARKLQESRDDNSRAVSIRSIYKDKTISEQFIMHCLDVFAIYNALRTQHRDGIKFFTKSSLSYDDFDYFPQPLPNAYFRYIGGRHYFLEIHQEDKPFFVLVRTIKKYIEYDESGVWEDTGTALPTLLVVVESKALQKRIGKFISRYDSELNIFIAIKTDIIEAGEDKWFDAHNPDLSYSLQQLKTL